MAGITNWKYLRNILTTDITTTGVFIIWFADYHAIPFMLLAKLFRKPVVVHIGGYEVYNAQEINYGNQRKLIRGYLSRWVIGNATTNVVMSRAYCDITRNIVPQSVVEVIPGCIDTRFCDLPPLPKSGAVTAYCTNSTYELKGLHIFDWVSECLPMLKKIKNAPHQQMMHEFRTAKVYCQLSYTESFGVSLLEAMSCGCVPVVTDRDALPEVVGDTGVIVPYEDVVGTVEAIKKALAMSGEPARDRARTFTVELRMKDMNKMLKRIAEVNQ